ncbi:MAG: hypothetical protein GF307_02460 [candidate division Zixibacteria bacterium]|nr:hypothetical protein [candidate division Zixibacteria bacterium]
MAENNEISAKRIKWKGYAFIFLFFFIIGIIIILLPMERYNSVPILTVIVIFFIMLLFPFMPGILEYFMPRDDSYLPIDMVHTKDPLFFGRAFRNLVVSKMEVRTLTPGKKKIILSKKEDIEVLERADIPEGEEKTDIIYSMSEMTTGDNVYLQKEVYTAGSAKIGKYNLIRAFCADGKIDVGAGTEIIRWLHSESNILIGTNCRLGRSAASKSVMEIDVGTQFTGIFGAPIISGNRDLRGFEEGDLRFPPPIPMPDYEEWEYINKYLSVNVPRRKEGYNEGVEFDPEEKGTDKIRNEWRIEDKIIEIPQRTTVELNFIARKRLIVAPHCDIKASIKAYEDMVIGENTIIHGNIFVEGDLRMSPGCKVLGNIFSQGEIYLGSNTTVGRRGSVKSVIGKKLVEIGINTVIYGYVLTEGIGRVV